jgi:hypothetical protein
MKTGVLLGCFEKIFQTTEYTIAVHLLDSPIKPDTEMSGFTYSVLVVRIRHHVVIANRNPPAAAVGYA